MNNLVREIKARIFEQASPEQIHGLRVDDLYGAPYSFWSSAKNLGLCTSDEFEMARRSYGSSMWNYRGD